MNSELINVLYLGPENALPWIEEEIGDGYDVKLALTPQDADQQLPGCRAILDAYMKVPFPAVRLQRATDLQLIVTATTGANHIDSAWLKQRGIPLLTLKGQREVLKDITAAAEHSWLLLMCCARGLRGAVKEVEELGWDRNNHPGIMLKGRTLGLVGCGRIGQWMSRYANAFGMQVFGYDPFLSEWPDGIQQLPLSELMSVSDFVSVHVNLTPDTEGLLTRDLLQQIKPGASVINTSRGEIIDEAALLDGLKSGHVGAAGLDVLQGEPEVADHPLVRYARTNNNLTITPHIGGFSPDALRHVIKFSCDRITAFFGQNDHA